MSGPEQSKAADPAEGKGSMKLAYTIDVIVNVPEGSKAPTENTLVNYLADLVLDDDESMWSIVDLSPIDYRRKDEE